MNQITSQETRKMIAQLSNQGMSCSLIAEQLGLSTSVVKKWRWRTSRGDYGTKMGRPGKGALSSFSSALVSSITTLRKKHPGWGPDHLILELKKEGRFSSLPSSASISRLLSALGLSRPYNKHRGVEQSKMPKTEFPHQCWQMDAEGNKEIKGIGDVSMINVKDCHSRGYLMNYPVVLQGPHNHATTQDYQTTLRACFVQFGKPFHLQVDHESIFFDNRSKSPFPTRFHLWLIALGIQLNYSRKARPTDQGIVERSHQTIRNQALKGQSFKSWKELTHYLAQRRQILNHQATCASLNEKAPFQAYPEANFPLRPFAIDQELEELDLEKVYTYLAKTSWFRNVSPRKTISLGKRAYYIKEATPKTEITISFDLEQKMLCFKHEKEQWLNFQPLKQMNKQWLSGNLLDQKPWPDLQLKIPFNYNFQKQNYWLQLYKKKTVTTL